MTITASYSEPSGQGSLEFADTLGRTPKRGRRKRVRDEWPIGGVSLGVELLPTGGQLPCHSIGTPDEWVIAGQTAHYKPELKRACRDCPARATCLAYALKWDVAGIWGGTSSGERTKLRRRAYLPEPLPVQLGRNPLDTSDVATTDVADDVFLAVANGHRDALRVWRDERSAVVSVRAASCAPDVAPEWADDPPELLLSDCAPFATDCPACCRRDIHDLVIPLQVAEAPTWAGLRYAAEYHCRHCGYDWTRRWHSAASAETDAQLHARNVRIKHQVDGWRGQ